MKAVIFDADGTLVDTNYLFVDAYYQALEACGERVTRAKIHKKIGMGIDHILPSLMDEEGFLRKGQRCKDLLKKIYDEVFLPRAMPLPGVRPLMETLKERGISLALASSSEKKILDHYIELLGIGDLLDLMVTGEEVTSTKPDPELFILALQKGAYSTDTTLVVGDSIWDILPAKRLGMKAIGVLSGGYCRCELIEAGAGKVYEDPQDLLCHISEWATFDEEAKKISCKQQP